MRTWYSGITVITLLVICAVSLAPLSTAQASGNFAIQVSPSTNRCGNVAADGITNSLILNCYESTPWGGDFVQSMEPVHDYCGPTAGMNLMRWYQHLPSIDTDTSYAQLGSLMRTNSWDPALMEVECNLACGLMPLACPACPSVPLLAVVGTLPRNMESALRTLQPPGFVFNRHDGPMDLATLQALLANGSPVVILGSEGATNLHWAMLTGIYLEGGVTKVRLANEPNVTTWDEFIAFWSLANLGGGHQGGARSPGSGDESLRRHVVLRAAGHTGAHQCPRGDANPPGLREL